MAGPPNWDCWACGLEVPGAQKGRGRRHGQTTPADRCQACYRKGRTRGQCSKCKGAVQRCIEKKGGGPLLCLKKCFGAARLLEGCIELGHHSNIDPADVEELCARNLHESPRTTLWVLPLARNPGCTLVLARTVALRSFGGLMGLLVCRKAG